MLSYIGVCTVLMLMSCADEAKKVEDKKPAVKIMAPFRAHQKVEVGPGLIFDVVSWGRGADSTSSVLILKSDSLKNDFYVASTDNLDGKLSEVFNTDMDIDGNPEVIVIYKKNDKYHSAEVLCYEFKDSANKIRFPDLTSKSKKSYRGNDNFYVKEGDLFREISLYEEDDKEGKKAIGKKIVRYGLEGNSFTVNEVE